LAEFADKICGWAFEVWGEGHLGVIALLYYSCVAFVGVVEFHSLTVG
jgi:hypothetical protein